MSQFKDKVAIVTGGGSGIGEAIVRRLAKDGLHVVAIARNAEKLNAVVGEITVAGGSAEAIAKLLPRPWSSEARLRRPVVRVAIFLRLLPYR